MNRRIANEDRGSEIPWTSYAHDGHEWNIAHWVLDHNRFWVSTKGVLAELRELIK